MTRKEITNVLDSVREEGRSNLTEIESKKVLSASEIPVTETILAEDELEAVDAARELKYPVVMKVASPDIIHKSDIGGVRVGLTSEIEVRQAYNDILENAEGFDRSADVRGVLVQRYVPDAQEVIVGITQDSTFGPTVMFGLGGVWVEILEDISFRLAPVSKEDAEEMIQEIGGYPVLSGARGETRLDIDALVEIIVKTSQLPMEYDSISEIDLNPIFVMEEGKGAEAVDARIFLKEEESED